MGGRFDCLIVALSCGMSCDFTLLGACGWASAWAESFGVGAEYMTERRDVHVVRIARIYRDGADHTRVVESDVGPGLARVGGLPHVVARRHVAAREWLAGAGVDHVRVQGRDREWHPRARAARLSRARRPASRAGGRRCAHRRRVPGRRIAQAMCPRGKPARLPRSRNRPCPAVRRLRCRGCRRIAPCAGERRDRRAVVR